MLATLERPVGPPIVPVGPPVGPFGLLPTRPAGPSASPPAGPVRLRLVAAAPVRPRTQVPAPFPRLPDVRTGPAVAGTLRMTMRARRLLAGLALLCAAAIGVVAIDVLTAVVPFESSTSYAAQEAPYVASSGSAADSGGLVPSAATSVTVGAGDTLWSLAVLVDPEADPRDVIAAIMTLNELDSPTLQPGQILQLP